MKEKETVFFISLFKEACRKCFGSPLVSPLSETDSKLLSNSIFEQTGLVIGAKSIKNYSLYVLESHGNATKKENPSVATLDTLARYVLEAPYTSEIKRKENESHFPYWFQYKSRFSGMMPEKEGPKINLKKAALVLLVISIMATGVILVRLLLNQNSENEFTEYFNSNPEDSLAARGWMIKNKDTFWWSKRNERQGHLALYTLEGDNWPLGNNPAGIKNLMMRRIHGDCFLTEVHLSDFTPGQNWQQAGILLSEDSTWNSKMLRISISYNSFFGGYEKPPEIIIQIVGSAENGTQSKPVEIAHYPLFILDTGHIRLSHSNLSKTAIRIEKKGNHYRFLYAAASVESFAFKEVISGDFNIRPGYVSIFSIKGWSGNKEQVPAYFDAFRLVTWPCGH
jgi:hypothetical protein